MTTLQDSRKTRSRAPLLAVLLCLAACENSEVVEGSGGNTFEFEVGTSEFGVAAGTPLAIQGEWLAFHADEAASGGTPMNTFDGDAIDAVAVVVNVSTQVETNLRVASKGLQWVGSELYIVVDEVLDNHDWNASASIAELVLLHWNPSMTDPVFVDSLDRDSTLSLVAVGSTLFYVSDHTTAAVMESSLYVIDAAFPETPRNVFTQDNDGGLSPRLLGEQDGLVLLALDETATGDNRDFNGDGNADDSFVLALLDGEGIVDPSGYNFNIRNTGMAIAGASSPLRAVSQGSHDWLVGFLVDEMAQEVSLNRFGGIILPGSWQISTCQVDDLDLDDSILHAIRFADWDADPGLNPPINTGLAGGRRVLIVADAVATICMESDEGDCIFNNDGDSLDSILRWIRIDSSPNGSTSGPVTTLSRLVALDTNLSGPAQAVAELDGVFVIQCDEVADNRDWDNDLGVERNLIAWLDPQDTSPTWQFNHAISGAPWYATATWMSELPGRTRLGIAFAESSNSEFLNNDGDQADSIPTFADMFGSVSPRLRFQWYGVALDASNAGISLSNGWGFFRVSEVAEGADINSNGQPDDILLVRYNLTNFDIDDMGALNTLVRPGVETEPDGISPSVAYISDETIFGADISGDSDANDLVVRYFSLP